MVRWRDTEIDRWFLLWLLMWLLAAVAFWGAFLLCQYLMMVLGGAGWWFADRILRFLRLVP
jgi:hypothetical protein